MLFSVWWIDELPSDLPPLPFPEPTMTSNDQLSYETETVCSICTEVLNDENENKQLKCGHSFHMNCINKWFIRQCKLRIDCTCPNCRAIILVDPVYAEDDEPNAFSDEDDEDYEDDDDEDDEDEVPIDVISSNLNDVPNAFSDEDEDDEDDEDLIDVIISNLNDRTMESWSFRLNHQSSSFTLEHEGNVYYKFYRVDNDYDITFEVYNKPTNVKTIIFINGEEQDIDLDLV